MTSLPSPLQQDGGGSRRRAIPFAGVIALVVVGIGLLAFGVIRWADLPVGLPQSLDTVTHGQLIVVSLRILLPLAILRWWVAGGIVALVIDAVDVILVEFFGPGGMGSHYSQLDKGLDTYYLLLEALVAVTWLNRWARWTALGLFAWRLVGALLFEATGVRGVLFVFPNLFENWWLYCVIVARWWPHVLPRSWTSTLVPLLVLLVPKLAQEYLLHVLEAQPWNWAKAHLL